MSRSRTRTRQAFSLIELMIAMLFLVIAFFGYVALHARILHSGQRLEEREVIRSATDFYSSILVARSMLGVSAGPDGRLFLPDPSLPGVNQIDTSKPSNLTWIEMNETFPKAFLDGMDETMQLSPRVLTLPYTYTWKKR